MKIKHDEKLNEPAVEPLSVRNAQALVETLPARIEDLKKALAERERELRLARNVARKFHAAQEEKERQRRMVRAGEMAEMTGLLNNRFSTTADCNSDYDDVHASLLVGAFLALACELSTASDDRLNELTQQGKEYQAHRRATRSAPPLHPAIAQSEADPAP